MVVCAPMTLFLISISMQPILNVFFISLFFTSLPVSPDASPQIERSSSHITSLYILGTGPSPEETQRGRKIRGIQQGSELPGRFDRTFILAISPGNPG